MPTLFRNEFSPLLKQGALVRNRLMLDTCICINILRGKNREDFKIIKQYDPGTVFISSITHSELMFGAYQSQRFERQRSLIDKLTQSIPVLDYPKSASLFYGKIRHSLSIKGKLIGANDLLIAAHALSEKCPLATHNIKEFNRIEGLKLLIF